jgi:hypothetical protein
LKARNSASVISVITLKTALAVVLGILMLLGTGGNTPYLTDQAIGYHNIEQA